MILWGSNIPQTRTPDAHFMTEARYKGQKVVVVSPDYAGHTKFADHWLPADGRHRRRAGDGDGPRDPEGVLRRSRGPATSATTRAASPTCRCWSTLDERDDGTYVAGAFLRASDLGDEGENAEWKTVVYDSARGEAVVPNGSIGFRWGEEGAGRWNLDLDEVDPALSLLGRPRRDGRGDAAALRGRRDRGRHDDAPRRPGQARRRAARDDRPRPRARPVRRRPRRPAGRVAERLRRRLRSPTRPAWQEPITGVDAGPLHPDRPRVRRQRRAHRGPLDDRHGRRHQPLVPLRPDLPGDARPGPLLRLSGRQRRRLGPLRRPGEGPPDHRLDDRRLRARLVAAAAPAAGDPVLVPGDRPVALRDLRRRGVHLAGRQRRARQAPHGRLPRARRPARLAALATRPSTATRSTSPTRPRRRASSRPSTSSPSSRPGGSASPARTPTTRPTSRASCRSGGRTCSAPRARATSTSSGTCSASPTRPCARDESAPEQRPEEVEWHDEAPDGKLDLFTTLDFRMNGSCIYSDVVLPAATWYEKHDISSTDLHPFVHPFNAAIPPPWEAKTRLGRVQPDRRPSSAGSPRSTSAPAPTSSPAPLLHDTPESSRSRAARSATGGPASASRSPGKTMPKLVAGRARLHRGRREDERARPAGREGRDRRQGRRLEAGARGRRARPPQRPLERRRAGRRAAVAAPRRRRLRGDPGALGDDQRPARGRELPGARAPDRARARPGPRGARRRAAHLRRDRRPAAQGDRLGRVVGARVARASLLAVHRQRRAADPVADADRPPAALTSTTSGCSTSARGCPPTGRPVDAGQLARPRRQARRRATGSRSRSAT